MGGAHFGSPADGADDTTRPHAPWPSREGYDNGQHRAQAMLDAAVRRVLIERH